MDKGSQVTDWLTRMDQAYKNLPDDDRNRLNDWEKENVNGCTVFREDWPGWAKVIGVCPDRWVDDRKEFRERRFAAIGANSTPVQLDHPPLIVAHLLPQKGYETDLLEMVDLNELKRELKPMVSKRPSTYDAKTNDDGYVTYAGTDEPCYAWTQIFHDGKIEIVRASYYDKDSRFIDVEYEGELLLAIQRGLKVEQNLGIRHPVHVTISVLGAAGCQMRRGEGGVVAARGPVKSEDNDMKGREVMVPVGDHELTYLARLMKSSFDRVARACGVPGSLNYDTNGNWRFAS